MKILVIPHHYSPHLAIREIELARCWAKRLTKQPTGDIDVFVDQA